MNEQYFTSLNGYIVKDPKSIHTYNTISDMKSDMKLKDGTYVKTKGYYSINDGGNAEYVIVNDNNLVDDGGSVHELNNTLKAVLIPQNNTISIKQFGARESNVDNTESIQNAINYIAGKDLKLIINRGNYYISHINISNSCNIEGESKYYSCLKSIDNNNSEYLLKIENNGLFYCKVSNFAINGNKANNERHIDGLLLYCSTVGVSDRYSNISDLYIYDCTGNGVLIDGANTDYDVREIRLNNITIMQNNKNGIYAKSCTDSIFTNISSSFNLMNGFIFSSSNNKISNCKAFWNGRGYEEEVDIERTPASGFTETSDETYNPNKTYYTRTGNNVQNDWYVFTEFTGSEFDSETTYYENTTPYYKRYSGFEIAGHKNILTNCDTQDNFGDGFKILGTSNILESIGGDGNGLYIPKDLPSANANIVSYETANMTQTYYGVYIKSTSKIELTGYFDNFRYSSKGAMQRGPVYIVNSSNLSGDIVCNNQVTDKITSQNSYQPTITIKSNGLNYVFNFDLSSINLGTNLSFNNLTGGNASFVKRVDGIVYYKFIVKDTNNHILNDSNERVLFTLPYYLRPSNNIFPTGGLTSNGGYEINNYIGAFIGSNGNVSIRSNNYASFSSMNAVVIEGSFVANE